MIKRNKYNYYNAKYVLENEKRYFNILHVIRNKKQIILCVKCYDEIHAGTVRENHCVEDIKKLKKIL